ncbi:MAG: hypothetical protein ABSH08_03265 [Tepidisphaeraceae bacterium]
MSLGNLLFASHFARAVQVGDLLVADSQGPDGHGIILDINPQTGAQTVVASGGYLNQPNHMCLDPSNDTLIISDYGGIGTTDVNGAILRINPFTGQQSVVSVGGSLFHPTAVAFDANGDLVVTEAYNVLLINPANGDQTIVASGGVLAVTTGIAVAKNGNYFVSNFQSPGVGSGVVEINPTTGSQTRVSTGGNMDLGPEDLWIDNTNAQRLLVAEAYTGAGTTGPSLLGINSATGAQSVISSEGSLGFPTAVTQDSSGNSYVTDQLSDLGGANVVRVNLNTGQQRVISSGGYLETPLGIVVIPEPASIGIICVLAGACFTARRLARR